MENKIDYQLEQIATVAYSFKKTIYHTFFCAKEMAIAFPESCMVECGVGAGGNLMAIQKAVTDSRLPIRLYGYDSFQGIPLASSLDAEQPGIGKITHDVNLTERERLVSSGITVHQKEEVLYNFDRFGLPTGNVSLIQGWFQDTLPHNDIESISLLRLDGDLYESTLVCMEHLYHKLCVNGILIIDDYALDGCRLAIEDYFAGKSLPVPELTILPNSNGVAYFTKR